MASTGAACSPDGQSIKDGERKSELDGSLPPCSLQLSSFIKNKTSYSLSSCFSAVEKIVSTSLKQLLINIESWWLALELLSKSEIGEDGAALGKQDPLVAASVFLEKIMTKCGKKKKNHSLKHFVSSPTLGTKDRAKQGFGYSHSSSTKIQVHTWFHIFIILFKGHKYP